MTTFAHQLASSASSAAAAYLQFIQEAPFGDFKGFVFVEDRPDIEIYSHFLSHVDALAYYGCGGKNGVLEVYSKISGSENFDRCCFIVDRDLDSDALGLVGAITTSSYSWESHLADSDAVGRIVRRRSYPTLSPASSAELVDGWQLTIHAFRSLLSQHTALLIVQRRYGIHLSLGKFPVTQGSIFSDGKLQPGEDAQVWINEKAERAIDQGVSAAELGELTSNVFASGLVSDFRGKTLFSLLKKFVRDAFTARGCEYIGDVSSAVRMIESLPNDWSVMRYIPRYVEVRLGGG